MSKSAEIANWAGKEVWRKGEEGEGEQARLIDCHIQCPLSDARITLHDLIPGLLMDHVQCSHIYGLLMSILKSSSGMKGIRKELLIQSECAHVNNGVHPPNGRRY